ncbi:hypothetical protein AUJ46_06435 [Candidatus Peregrinibacteria bacterium CG1_02_54_53]|nr:MAG: hypothetical protein AUJ46_06435 [Candidatus Peregrinibacteria bacterium CG1_02_54_53]
MKKARGAAPFYGVMPGSFRDRMEGAGDVSIAFLHIIGREENMNEKLSRSQRVTVGLDRRDVRAHPARSLEPRIFSRCWGSCDT